MRAAAALAAIMTLLSPGAGAATIPWDGGALVGEVGHDVTAEEDTLVDVARRNRLGYEELVLANPSVDRWLPGAGTTILLPTRFILPNVPRDGIVVNLAEARLYYFPKPKQGGARVVETFAISAGREDWQTPETRLTHIARRLENPAWYPPKTIRAEHARDGRPLAPIVPPGPDNPLGPLALKLAIPGGYFIHGSSKPFGIGMKVTHGCVRLYPEDMATLFKIVPQGTKVRVVNQPYKVAFQGGVLYVEAHPLFEDGVARPVDGAQLREHLLLAERARPGYAIDWSWIDSVALQPRGVPIVVRRQAPSRG